MHNNSSTTGVQLLNMHSTRPTLHFTYLLIPKLKAISLKSCATSLVFWKKVKATQGNKKFTQLCKLVKPNLFNSQNFLAPIFKVYF